MKKVLMILGGIFLVVIVLGIGLFAFLAVKGSRLDKESKQYVDTAVPAIVTTWDKQALIDRASMEFINSVKGDDLDKIITMFRKLGRFKEYKGCEGQAGISITPQQGKIVTAAYVAKAEFETGPADIQITLIKHGDKWEILGFRINSKVFFE